MTLINAFGNLALDASVMCTTPILKQIDSDIKATPYVYVVNPLTFPGIQNVNVANPSTPPSIQNVNLLSTPISIVYQGSPYTVIGTVDISNFPSEFNVNVANPSTPPVIQNVNLLSTPIVQLANTQVTVQNWPGTQNVNVTSTPIVYAVIVNQTTGGAASNVTVTNFPGVQNVNIANVATPPTVQNVNVVQAATPLQVTVFNNSTPVNVAITSTPIVSIANLPAIQVESIVNFPGVQNVNLANPSTPPSVQAASQSGIWSVGITSTPIVQLANTQVEVQGWPASQNVVLTSTPVVSILNTNVGVNNWPASQTVFVSNFATPQPVLLYGTTTPIQTFTTGTVSVSNFPATQNVNITSTPIVQLANTQVEVQGWPATQAVTQSGAWSVGVTSTPIVYTYQGNAVQNVAVQNFNQLAFATPLFVNIVGQSTPLQVRETATPITIAYQPSPYFVTGTVSVGNFPSTQNVAITSFTATPPSTIVYQGSSNWNIIGSVSVSNFPASQNVVVTSTPVVSVLNLNPVAINNWPAVFPTQGIVNVNLANQSTPPPTQNVNIINASTPLFVDNALGQTIDVSVLSTPIVYAQISSMPAISVTANPPVMQNINFAEQATPAIVYLQSTPIVYAQISSMPAISVTSTAPVMQNVNFAQQATPVQVTVIGPSTPVVKHIFDSNQMGSQGALKVQNLFGVNQQMDSLGNIQPAVRNNINLYSTAAGYNATPLILASSTKIKVLGYAFTSTAAGFVAFMTTPMSTGNPTALINMQAIGGFDPSLKSSYLAAGPFSVAAQGGVAYAGSIIGAAFDVDAATPLYIVSSNGNIGGHLTYVFI